MLTILSDEQIIAPVTPSILPVKDEIANLWAWQRLSIARLEAARFHGEPVFPQ